MRLSVLICVLAASFANAGCSYRMGSLFGKDDDKTEHTGSVAGARAPVLTSASQDGDLALAKAAASDLLGGGADSSMPWENPATGARGTVTPLANSYTQDGFTCRDFIASYVREGQESWLQGGACRMHQGKWEVRDLRPWKRS